MPLAYCVSSPLGVQGRGRGQLRLRPSRSHQPRGGQAAGELTSDSSPGRVRTESPAQRGGAPGRLPSHDWTAGAHCSPGHDLSEFSCPGSAPRQGLRNRARSPLSPTRSGSASPAVHTPARSPGADGRPGALLGTARGSPRRAAPRPRAQAAQSPPSIPQPRRTHKAPGPGPTALGASENFNTRGKAGYTAAKGGFRECAGESQEDRLL